MEAEVLGPGLPPGRNPDHANEGGRPAVGTFTPRQLQRWQTTATDLWVVATLREGYSLQFRRRPLAAGLVKHTVISNPVKAAALDQELDTLLAKGAIEPVEVGDRTGFYSTYFLVTKKTGGFRPILDLRGLNVYLKDLPFRMLTVADVLGAIAPGEWFTSVDLKDAYFHVPIAARHRQFLRFSYRGQRWQFRVLPFGLSLSPRVFSRCVAAALGPLHKQGLKILPYLDDWLICAGSREEVVQHTELLLNHVSALGLRVNLEKSDMEPRQLVDFIGVTLDSVGMQATPSVRRVEDILRLLDKFHLHAMKPYVAFQRMLGKLTSVSAVVPLGLLQLRPLQIWMNALGLDPKRDRNKRVTVDQPCLDALLPWRNRAYLLRGVPIGRVASRREVVTTDACLGGWGAVWQCRMARGRWSRVQSQLHINVLELTAVQLALHHFLPELQGRHVLVRTDNTTVVYYINHQGGVRSEQLLNVARELLEWAEPRLASLRAVYYPGISNVDADLLSRGGPPPGEWMLHPEVVKKIWQKFGQASVDLYATAETAHCPRWFSRHPEPGSMGSDALAQEWPRELLYAYPPLTLMGATLQRVKDEAHRVLLVAPYWPARPWFPLLFRLSQGRHWPLPERKDLLRQMGGRIWHPHPQRLQLAVWPLGLDE